MTTSSNYSGDALLTIKQAASILGIPYFKVQRAAKAGLIPTYSLLNSRKYVKLSDIQKVMASSLGLAHRDHSTASGRALDSTNSRGG